MTNQVQRDFAIEVVKLLREAGHEALWAGGCVRDALLGKEPKDYDIATNAEPEKVRTLFGRKRTIAVGASFGVITILPPRSLKAEPIEVATFRSDGSYIDGRRPDSVRFTNAKEDASRRDFTINGMFFDPIEDKVIDYVDGQQDLERGLIRAIGNPEQRFAEDRLRMLRAVRFAATLQFNLDPETLAAVCQHAPSITEVSPERIGAELKRMLVDSNRSHAIRLLLETRLFTTLLPKFSEEIASDMVAISEHLTRLSTPTSALALATLLCGVADFTSASRVAREIKWTNKETERVGWLVQNQEELSKAEERPWSEIQPLLAAEGGPELVQLRRAKIADADSTDQFCRERLAWDREKLDPAPFIVGADLIAVGLRPGPSFKQLLSKARAYQLDQLVADKNESLEKLGLLST